MKLEEGQKKLVNDLEELLKEVKDGEFGDFTNKKYAVPKTALENKLNRLRNNVIYGEYD